MSKIERNINANKSSKVNGSPPKSDYIPQHPTWTPAEGWLLNENWYKKDVAKMKRPEIIAELEKKKIKFDLTASTDVLRALLKDARKSKVGKFVQKKYEEATTTKKKATK